MNEKIQKQIVENLAKVELGIKSIGRRQTRAMLEWRNRWVVEFPPGYQNRHARRAAAVRVGRLLKLAKPGTVFNQDGPAPAAT